MTTPWRPPDRPGDRDPAIAAAKRKLRRYSYGQGLGESEVYTVEFGVALLQFKVNRNEQILRGAVTGMPGMALTGALDWATKKNLEILPADLAPPKATVPVVLTVAGHLGAMDTGPAFLTARALEDRGLVRVQMVGYDNVRIPFNNDSGIRECDRLVNDPTVLPPGTPWTFASHSQGGIVTSRWWRERVEPNRARWPYSHFLGGVHFANPMRPMGVVAPWVLDPPGPDSEGLAHDCLESPIPGVAEVARRGDLYADKKRDAAGEHKTAIYRAVQGQLFGKDSLTEQIAEIALSGNPMEVFAMFQAIIGGVQFLFNMDPHNIFDLGPAIGHLESLLPTA